MENSNFYVVEAREPIKGFITIQEKKFCRYSVEKTHISRESVFMNNILLKVLWALVSEILLAIHVTT